MTSSGAAELLVRCLSVDPRAPVAGFPFSAEEWSQVVELAVDFHVAPLVFKRLKGSGGRDSVPAEGWWRLRRAYFASLDRNTRLYRELRAVLMRLSGAGIPVVVLKGAYLAEGVYQDIALRPMCDADLLVPMAELGRAQAVLLAMGGACRQFEDAESVARTRPHLPQVRLGELAVELHWSIVPPTGPFRVDVEGLWARARPALVAGVEMLALSPEDLLVHLCLHSSFCDALAGSLRTLCDIAETVSREAVNWDEVARRAREWGAVRHAGLALHLARCLVGAKVPKGILECDEQMLEAARGVVLGQAGLGEWRPFFANAHATTFRDKARLSLRRVFLSRAEMAATYPSARGAALLFPWYARRVGRVVRSYAVHSLRRARLLATSPERRNTAALVRWLSGTD